MTPIKKTLLLITIPLAITVSTSTYSCGWKKMQSNKILEQKILALTQEKPLKSYASSWSDARNSELLKFPTTASKDTEAASTASKTSSIN